MVIPEFNLDHVDPKGSFRCASGGCKLNSASTIKTFAWGLCVRSKGSSCVHSGLESIQFPFVWAVIKHHLVRRWQADPAILFSASSPEATDSPHWSLKQLSLPFFPLDIKLQYSSLAHSYCTAEKHYLFFTVLNRWNFFLDRDKGGEAPAKGPNKANS